MPLPPFHLSIEVEHYTESIHFFTRVLGGQLEVDHGKWCNIDLYGHQLTLHNTSGTSPHTPINFHWGLNVDHETFDEIFQNVKKARVEFILRPEVQNQGTANERRKMVFKDPNGYVLEFKALTDATTP